MNLLNWITENTILTFLIALLLIFFLTVAFISISNLFSPPKATPPQRTFPYNYQFPEIVLKRWKAKYPNLSDVEYDLAQKSLLQFFEVLFNNKTSVAMVSEIADELWHEFILHTKAYCEFCEKTFGKYIHHNPTESNVEYDWRNKEVPSEFINLYKFSLNSPFNIQNNTPLIFMIDQLLKINTGYQFSIPNIQTQYSNMEEQKAKEEAEKKKKKKNDSNCGSCNSGCSGCGGD